MGFRIVYTAESVASHLHKGVRDNIVLKFRGKEINTFEKGKVPEEKEKDLQHAGSGSPSVAARQ